MDKNCNDHCQPKSQVGPKLVPAPGVRHPPPPTAALRTFFKWSLICAIGERLMLRGGGGSDLVSSIREGGVVIGQV
jgi:hypothetical protein